MDRKLIVISADALTCEDLEYLQTLPNFQKYLAGGSRATSVRSIYPTITYPCHTTIATGVWPEKHGITGNFELKPELDRVPWRWFYHHVQWQENIFSAAKRAGLTTAGIFWPVTGNHPDIDYLIAEYWPQPGDTDIREVYRRAGSSEEVLDIIEEELQGIRICSHPDTDDFQIRCACSMIRKFQPDLLMLHPGNVDAYRHNYGLWNDKVTVGVEETDKYIGQIMSTVEEMGLLEKTNLVLTSDHGMLNVSRIININVLLAGAGLITTNKEGKICEWQAYCQSGGTQALVYLSDSTDEDLKKKVGQLLHKWQEEGVYGIGRVYTEEECRREEHLGGPFSFVLETDGYTAFGNGASGAVVSNYDISDYRYGRATHGHLPDKGPQPVFVAKGPNIRANSVKEGMHLIDEAPTFAKILGIELENADGVAIEEFVCG
ncbi:MAG: alkaline phosphatase family protein [Tyzzerella sp.]|nr:alkaline phosphatase family protein [Tyzzerella sp.]